MLTKRYPGFTIVELLIVIVVIAILATISIVAFNGVQQRARNTARISAISQYVKLFSLYALQNNGAYPAFTSGACLGSGYTDASCSNTDLSPTAPGTTTEQASFTAQLSTAGSLPDYPKLNALATGPGNAAGAFIYNYGPTNETPARTYRIVYFLEGSDQDCGQSRILRSTAGATIGTGAWTVGVGNYKNSNPTGLGRTLCMLSLLNPDEF